MHVSLLVWWGILIAWLLAASLVSFFIIAPHLPDRGATPIRGARVGFFTPEHWRQLGAYRVWCQLVGRSLVWWRVVRWLGILAVPWRLIGVALSLCATR
jgi:hypothetical protein